MKYKFNSLSKATAILLGLAFNTALLTPLWAMEDQGEVDEQTPSHGKTQKPAINLEDSELAEYIRKATNDDPEAQFELGRIYKKNKSKAIAYGLFQRAANSGLAAAQYRAGLMLLCARGTESNKPEG